MDQGTNPVNPYAPTGAPYAPGSNTPAPVFTPISPAPEKPKFFTKKFIIFTVIGLILIIAAVVAGVIIKGINTNSQIPATNRKNAFYSYANYLLHSEDSSNKISANTDWSIDDSAIAVAVQSEQPMNYLTILNKKLKAFYETLADEPDYNNEGDGSSLLLKPMANNLVTQLEALIAFKESSQVTVSDMINEYLNSGKEQMIEKVNDNYNAMFSSSNTILSEYAEEKNLLANNIASLYDIYDSAGCIKDKEVDNICVKNGTERDAVNSLTNSISDAQDGIAAIEQGFVPNIVEGTHLIYETHFIAEDTTK